MEFQKKTKIVATIGPVTASEERLSELLKAGFNIMRLNFSHGDFAEHQVKVENLKKAIAKTGLHAAILQDLGGPKIRIGDFKSGSVVLKEGQKFTLTTSKYEGDENKVSVNYPQLPKEVKKGHIIFLHDGRKKLEVLEVKGTDVICKILVGGEIKGKRGVNLPDSDLSISSMTEKDKVDVEFGIKNNVDFIALSFVRRPSDITELREILDKKKSKAKIIAKIETPQALTNIDEILKLTDGVMVARGDLAIEIPAENVPIAQKMLIQKCNELANAIFDGTDAVMLSEETTLGDFPIESVNVMTRVARKIENDPMYKELVTDIKHPKRLAHNVTDAVTSEVIDTAQSLGAKFIVALTATGFTARMISRYKPLQPILAFTFDQKTFNQMLLTFGVTPILIPKMKDFDAAKKAIRDYMIKNKLVVKEDRIVIATALPFGKMADTNTMIVDTI